MGQLSIYLSIYLSMDSCFIPPIEVKLKATNLQMHAYMH